ncbi:MAG: acyltransferase, partial [Cyanobacteria bacterium]|nr:acyltransferase [Cyanobacteriota bacterium]
MKAYFKLVHREWDILYTHWILRLLDILGSGYFGCLIRHQCLKFLGFRFQGLGKIAQEVVTHSLRDQVLLGDNTFLNRGVVFDATDKVTIGRCCDIGFRCLFTTTDHELLTDFKNRRKAMSKGPIVVEDFVWLGANVTVLGGVTIGRGAVIGSSSLVTKNIPPNALALGSPAK